MSKLLFNERPLVLNPELARAIGLNEAIILQQIHYWIELNKKAGRNEREGFTWTYNTYKDWQEQFPFWSERTVHRIIKALESAGLLITGSYNKAPLDRTKWYRVDHDKLASCIMTDCQLHHANLSRAIPESNTESNNNNSSGIEGIETIVIIPTCFEVYEKNIGMLTPIIADLLKASLEEYPEDWVNDAITESVKAGIRSWRYMEGILRRWKTEGRDIPKKDWTPEMGKLVEPSFDSNYVQSRVVQLKTRHNGAQPVDFISQLRCRIIGYLSDRKTEREVFELEGVADYVY